MACKRLQLYQALHEADGPHAGIMEASIAAIELRRREQAAAAQANVADRRDAQASQEQQGLPSVSVLTCPQPCKPIPPWYAQPLQNLRLSSPTCLWAWLSCALSPELPLCSLTPGPYWPGLLHTE